MDQDKIMDYSDRHDKELVDAINKMYNIPESFAWMSIKIRDLIDKYKSKCERKGITSFNQLSDYLMKVAKNDDLRLIIDYVNSQVILT